MASTSASTSSDHNNSDQASSDQTSSASTSNSTSAPNSDFERYIQNLRHANKYFEFLNSRVEKNYESTEEYFKDLDDWLNQTYSFWNVTAKFPHYLAQQQVESRLNAAQATRQREAASSTAGTNRQDNRSYDGVECRVPALWKRLAAEFIDFLILFVLKLAITFVVVDFFDFVDWDKFAIDLFQGGDKLEYNTVVKMTQDLVILELVHRLVVCAFETYWLTSGREGRLGGATPGKSLMGLRVLSCVSIDDMPIVQAGGVTAPTVLVKPGTYPGLQVSFMRSMSKNLMLTFFFPATFFLYYFRHNRTAYDLFSGTVVVEEPLVRHRPHQN